jgi:putative colanic acid biosynthesis acetyltransferase WcaF
VGRGVKIYPSAKIWAPWNLELGDFSMIGPNTDIYSVAKIILEENVWVSQYSYLCTATHNVDDLERELITKPIVIKKNAWIAADVFIGPGVIVGEGAVVGARSSVFKDVKAWTIVGGNPAKFITKTRLH